MVKGQIKIQQTALMLMAITLFFILVGMFVLVFRFSDIRKMAVENEEKRAMLLVSKLASSPEFSCEDAFGAKSNCIDADKVMVLLESIEIYRDFWEVAEIQIRKIYPETNEECTKDNYPDCGIINVLSKDIKKLASSSAFVILCRKEAGEYVYDKCELGKLIVKGEDET